MPVVSSDHLNRIYRGTNEKTAPTAPKQLVPMTATVTQNGHANGVSNGHANDAPNGFKDDQESKDQVRLSPTIPSSELFSALTEVEVDFEKFFCIGKPRKVLSHFTIKLTELTYLPKIDNPRRDWVASVAVPAFLAHRAQNEVKAFATVGTGGGLDAIAAMDIFNPECIAMTDLHQPVVDAAAENFRIATAGLSCANFIAAAGDILAPLANKNCKFDLIYENLPNIPLDDAHEIDAGQTSSTYVPHRSEDIPAIATNNLLALHFLALRQAKSLLSDTGAIISSIGGRVEIAILLKMASEAGYRAEILTYTWKIQSEPEEVIGGYKKNQEDGLGPFYFYPVAILEKTFGNLDPAAAGRRAEEIEGLLRPHAVDALTALELHRNGLEIGHTVAIVRSTLN
ncbi:hypothetical protein B0H16DRAFT_1514425 [Mycena metata]|uniref:Methyltransferase domain-containing protein n=1 Tax=Mycena metata TaxID=1033252 RepID=A0AAD7JTQ1_9AGAR|nr:hypothetical protein B0H16DRAFT_1514425 [Mycena metata]